LALTFLQHAVKFSQGTSQLVPPLRPTLMTELSLESVGMSSFIDFDEDDKGKGQGEGDGLNAIPLSPPLSSPKGETNENEAAAAKTDFAEVCYITARYPTIADRLTPAPLESSSPPHSPTASPL